MSRRSPHRVRPLLETLEGRRLLSAITPAQLRHAYGLDSLAFSANGQNVAANGAGQTVAIVVAYHNPFLQQELRAFDATYGLPDPTINQVNLAGNQLDDGWAEEEALDVEWAHSVAPAASILVVEAASTGVSDLMNAVNYARQQPGVSVVSMSWGTSEFRGETNYDSIFTTPAGHTGVTFVTASGDSGAWSGAEWPASSSHVVAVGGTTLVVDAAGNALSETAWGGSGGGLSEIVAEPSYQAGVQLTGRRTTPDVSMVADPATGVPVYVISPATGLGSWSVFGGTSLSAQLFGGVVAVANQGRAIRGLGSLDGPSQSLPAIYNATASNYVDVTSGSNGYAATAGYDLATGRGEPRTALLVNDLVGVATAVASVPTTGHRRTRIIRRARPRTVVESSQVADEGQVTSRAGALTEMASNPKVVTEAWAFRSRASLSLHRRGGRLDLPA